MRFMRLDEVIINEKIMGKEIQKIAVFTSGGDASGMNAAIRAVVRSAAFYKIVVYGIYEGYEGMIDNEIRLMNERSVGKIIDRGGTILRSARSMRFKTAEGRAQAYENLQKHGIDALVCIGGDGSLTGLKLFSETYGIPVIGMPGTIDNDLYGTDYTIGFDTAVNTCVEAIDKIRDTASSHNRLFFVEVMGRDAGFIALNTAIASGASAVMLPERHIEVDDLIALLEKKAKRGKSSSIVIVAEGNKNGDAMELAQAVRDKKSSYEIRVTVLGHIQRGGRPGYFDRVLASRMGVFAVESLLNEGSGNMVGIRNGEMVLVPLEKAIKMHADINADNYRIAEILSI